jgi:pyruvate carboxylase
MKMETTITAIADGTIKKIQLKEGVMLNSEDLVIRLD